MGLANAGGREVTAKKMDSCDQSGATDLTEPDGPLKIGSKRLTNRLILGTGRYDSFELMQTSLVASGTECVTVAIWRERLYDG